MSQNRHCPTCREELRDPPIRLRANQVPQLCEQVVATATPRHQTSVVGQPANTTATNTFSMAQQQRFDELQRSSVLSMVALIVIFWWIDWSLAEGRVARFALAVFMMLLCCDSLQKLLHVDCRAQLQVACESTESQPIKNPPPLRSRGLIFICGGVLLRIMQRCWCTLEYVQPLPWIDHCHVIDGWGSCMWLIVAALLMQLHRRIAPLVIRLVPIAEGVLCIVATLGTTGFLFGVTEVFVLVVLLRRSLLVLRAPKTENAQEYLRQQVGATSFVIVLVLHAPSTVWAPFLVSATSLTFLVGLPLAEAFVEQPTVQALRPIADKLDEVLWKFVQQIS